jgi:hypothetical protein
MKAFLGVYHWSPDTIGQDILGKQLVAGHAQYFYLEPYVREFKKVTFLRDPIARVISEHRYCMERDREDPSAMLKAHFLPSEGDPLDTAKNVSCLCLSRLDPRDPTISIERHLESAKEALLNDFYFVGITERMEESITFFYNLCGWKPPEQVPTYNISKKTHSYPPELLATIAERNWADIELYRFAQELFEIKKEGAIPFVEQKSIQWVDRVEYLFSEPLNGFGWSPRKENPEGIFRWLSSSEKGYIDFPLIATHSYSFKADLLIKPELIWQLRIAINNTPLTYIMRPFGPSKGSYRWYRCEATIPQPLLRSGETTRVEIAIQDQRHPVKHDWLKDYDLGRCGSNRILITRI